MPWQGFTYYTDYFPIRTLEPSCTVPLVCPFESNFRGNRGGRARRPGCGFDFAGSDSVFRFFVGRDKVQSDLYVGIGRKSLSKTMSSWLIGAGGRSFLGWGLR